MAAEAQAAPVAAQIAAAETAAPEAAAEAAAPVVKTAEAPKAAAAPLAAEIKAADAVAVETAEAVTAVAAGSSDTGGQTFADAKGSDTGAAIAVAAVETQVAAAGTIDTNALAAPAPNAQTQSASAATPAAQAPVRGSPETVEALSAEIVKRAGAQTTRFDVTLTPDDLGTVDVRIEIGRDGVMTASMKFDTVHAAQELRGKAGELRQALADAGFNVADNGLKFDVSSQNNGQSQNPFFAFQDWNDQGRGFSGRAFQAAMTAEEEIAITPELLPGLKTVADSGLDIRI